jgi:hypothetical protein
MRFRLFAALLALVAFSNTKVDALELRKVETAGRDRKLRQGSVFLISQADPDMRLCITAVQGTKWAGNLELQPCNMVTAPANQLWNVKGDKIISALGDGTEYCMMINHGNVLFDGVRVRLGDCIENAANITFDERSGFIRLFGESGEAASYYCLTNTGINANAGDKILAKPCLYRADYRWTVNVPDDEGPFGDLYDLYEYDAEGCVRPKSAPAAEGSELILDTCDAGRAWYPKDYDGFVILHSQADVTLCMQVGLGGIPQDGSWMRLMKCDLDEDLQRLSWEDGYESPIKLASRGDLCMVSQGQPKMPGDRLIMKKCSVRTFEWSGDLLDFSD